VTHHAGYSGTPLPKKLGIEEGTVVALVGAPDGFESLLAGAGVVRHGRRGSRDLTIVFVREPRRLGPTFEALARDANTDDVWIAWVKKASPEHTGVTENAVRDAGLSRGFVDFKVAAIDETWSGLRFKRRT
jgi:hypothetical protein